MYSRKEVDPTRKTIDLVHWREQYVNSWNTFFTVILWNVSKGMAFSVVDSQHGFRSGRSMEMQLVYTFHDIAKAWMRMHLYHWPFLDFSKPFDKFPLLRLLWYPLWSKSFFAERYQRVLFDTTFSTRSKVMPGVPQGTVLGTVLSHMYINDLSSNLNCTARLFADDCLL